MKKIYVLAVFLMLPFLGKQSFAQSIPTYTIPSYDILVDGYTDFREQTTETGLGKRDVSVEVRTNSYSSEACACTVWVYRLDLTTTLGPFTVACGQTLRVEIDEEQWGVLVNPGAELYVSVWTD
jgi:hypothetical protein